MVVQIQVQIDHRNECLEVKNYKFRRLQQCKYIGALITQQTFGFLIATVDTKSDMGNDIFIFDIFL